MKADTIRYYCISKRMINSIMINSIAESLHAHKNKARLNCAEVRVHINFPRHNSQKYAHPLLRSHLSLSPMGVFLPTIIGASLSEPHTSVTALQDACVCMYVCMYVCLRPYTENLN